MGQVCLERNDVGCLVEIGNQPSPNILCHYIDNSQAWKATFIGSSFVRRLDGYLKERREPLKPGYTIQFLGKGGAGYKETEAQVSLIDMDTDMVFMYVGGNEVKPQVPMSYHVCSMRRLLELIHRRIGRSKPVFIINLYERLKPRGWSDVIKYNRVVRTVNKRFKTISRRMSNVVYVNTFSGNRFSHPCLSSVLRADGVHLNDVGQGVLLWKLTGAMEDWMTS
ncbi:hypothetical protein LOTGIDRAFT_173498 [Lottia gigantea]|uniref:SGNH hydrolase-type esterase domain-containing protein n=1 Tax=Lottia gigantea TaxID=225164 RepID=V4AXU8_LOTGI|nr:hypothetical protein LOTGIDRAFT_173498 [Lottia gigantea]ESO99840.1 hypothetical protein LOTGIDRAFT_173498 [Lottia gigantea]